VIEQTPELRRSMADIDTSNVGPIVMPTDFWSRNRNAGKGLLWLLVIGTIVAVIWAIVSYT